MGVGGRREAERGRQALADVRPVRARVVAPVHAPVVLQIQPVRGRRILCDLVHALPELRVRIRQEHRGDTGVGRLPALSAVARAEHPGRRDRDRHGKRIALVGEDGVQPLSAAARHPPRARRMLPERADQLEALAAVLGAEQPGRLRPRVHHVGLGRRRVQLPHPLQRSPGVLGELDRRPRRLGPGAAQIVGVEHRRTPVRAVTTGQQSRRGAAGVDGDRIQRLRVEVRTLVELPDPTPPTPDEQAFSRAHREQNLRHSDHLRCVFGYFAPTTRQSAPHH